MPEARPHIHPSIKRLSNFLGVSPRELVESTSSDLAVTPECLSLDYLLECRRLQELPEALQVHLKACETCAGLWAAMVPDPVRIQAFHEERAQLASESVRRERFFDRSSFDWASPARLAYASLALTAVLGVWLSYSIYSSPGSRSLDVVADGASSKSSSNPPQPVWERLSKSSSVEFHVVSAPAHGIPSKPIVVTAKREDVPLVPVAGKSDLENQVALVAASTVVLAEKHGSNSLSKSDQKASTDLLSAMAASRTDVSGAIAAFNAKDRTAQYDQPGKMVIVRFSNDRELEFPVDQTVDKIRLYQSVYLQNTANRMSLMNVPVGKFSVTAKGVLR